MPRYTLPGRATCSCPQYHNGSLSREEAKRRCGDAQVQNLRTIIACRNRMLDNLSQMRDSINGLLPREGGEGAQFERLRRRLNVIDELITDVWKETDHWENEELGHHHVLWN